MKAISFPVLPVAAALFAWPLAVVAGEAQALQCGSVRLEMDASLVQSSSETLVGEDTTMSLTINGTDYGPYKMIAAMHGMMGGTRMTVWKYKTKNLTVRLMTTSKDSEPDLYVNKIRSSCKLI